MSSDLDEIKALIDMLLGGFNSKDLAGYSRAFAGEVVVIDGMAPYRWIGPNAQGRWFADAEKWAHELGVADERIEAERIVHSEFVGTSAYAVLAATLFFNIKGSAATRKGLLTFTFAKHGNEWRIESQAWGRLS